MHSSLINKIRILKPRKKVTVQQSIKSFSGTINNDNCHSSIVLQTKNDDMPPPLEAPQNIESEQKSKWVPFYVVNVSKVGGALKTSLETEVNNKPSTSNENNSGSHVKKTANTEKELFVNISNQNTTMASDNKQKLPLIESITPDTPISIQASTKNNQKVNVSQRVTRQRPTKGMHSVNCFLCPTKFQSVQAMQDHYFENHKHKKRTSSNRTKCAPKKIIKSSKLKDPLTLNEEDCASGDGEPKCPICSIYFNTKDEVKNHMTNVHCYKCSECHNTFYTLFQFTDHRCAKYVKQRKGKLKKKKLKTPPSKKPELEKDPLSLPPPNKYVKILPKNVPILPKVSYPLIIHYSAESPISSLSTSTQASNTKLAKESQSINVCNTISPSLMSVPSTIVSMQCTRSPENKNITQNLNTKKVKKRLVDYSVEELTSKEFTRMKLDEITKNPHLSIRWIPNKNQNQSEFFSCGRCNVLCEDKTDYIEHLEECLRLSNVSLLSTKSPAKRILKLKSEIISQQNDKFGRMSINKNLLKELKAFMGNQILELIDNGENTVKSNSKLPEQKSESFTHSDIKGSISITKLSTATEGNVCYKTLNSNKPIQAEIPAPMIMTQALKYPSSVSSHTPMVIIPINNSFPKDQTATPKEASQDEPDYPNISITDKSKSVTWNFIGSETGAVLSVESPDSNGKKALASTDSKKKSKITSSNSETASGLPFCANYQSLYETEFIQMKSEPQSPAESEPSTPLTFEGYKDSIVSMELVLDEEIKMEVEDEVVDDKF